MRLLPVILVTLGAVLQCAAYIYTLTCSGPLYNIKSAFANAGLLNPNLPDVGDDTYLATWYKDEVLVGTEFDQRETSFAPTQYFAADPRYNYTVILIGFDLASGCRAQTLHWVISDLMPLCEDSVTYAATTQITYLPPYPRGDLEYTYYAFYLYVQPGNATFPWVGENAGAFNILDYAGQAGLQGPISGNFLKLVNSSPGWK